MLLVLGTTFFIFRVDGHGERKEKKVIFCQQTGKQKAFMTVLFKNCSLSHSALMVLGQNYPRADD